MERPEKIKIILNLRCQLSNLITGLKVEETREALDYALECMEWVEILPNEKEIAEIIYSLKNDKGELPPDRKIAEAIHNRIHNPTKGEG